MSKDYNIESHALTVETEAVEQELKENGKAKKQIKGKTTIEGLKTQTYCLMKARADHVSEARRNQLWQDQVSSIQRCSCKSIRLGS